MSDLAGTTYRKLVLTELGEDFRSSVTVEEAPLSKPAPGEALVRNAYAGINGGRDLLLSRNACRSYPVSPPIDLGAEAVGEVVDVGEGVVAVRPGDAVLIDRLGCGYREYASVPATDAVKVDAARPELLALVPNGVAASIALSVCGGMKRDETVLITAAAGSAGHVAVQLAKRAGNHVIGICGSPKRAGVLRELGCDRAINHRDETVRDVLEDEYPGGIDLVLDSVGGKLFDTCVEHLAPLGRLVVLGFVSDYDREAETPKQARIYHRLFWKSASVRGCSIPPHFPEAVPEHRERLLGLLAAGQVRGLVDKTSFSGVDSIPDAVEHHALGKACGKVVVSLGES